MTVISCIATEVLGVVAVAVSLRGLHVFRRPARFFGNSRRFHRTLFHQPGTAATIPPIAATATTSAAITTTTTPAAAPTAMNKV